MSIVMRSYEADVPRSVLDYAYTRADTTGTVVVIYRRVVETDDPITAIKYEYIATGTDSDMPEGSEVFTAIGPRSPLYDRGLT